MFKADVLKPALDEAPELSQAGAAASRQPRIRAARYHTALLLARDGNAAVVAVLSDFGLEGNDSPRIIGRWGWHAAPADAARRSAGHPARAGDAGRRAYLAARLLQASQNAFETLVTRYPDTPNVNYAYGVLLAGEQPEQAIERFKRELKVSPTHVLAKIQIAFAYIKRSEFAEAKPWAEQAAQEAPTLFIAHNALGQVLLATGDVEGAVRALENAVKLAPDSPAMHFALARAYRANCGADADREQAGFARLDRLIRQQRTGENSVGGMAPPK